jgi:hypothetical protein
VDHPVAILPIACRRPSTLPLTFNPGHFGLLRGFLPTEEKKRLRELLDSELSWTEEEEQAIEEGIRSREEGAKHQLGGTRPANTRETRLEIVIGRESNHNSKSLA